jgi:CheY-like chemotaxis protein
MTGAVSSWDSARLPSLRTVLVVDDQDVLRKVIGHELEEAGFRVVLAEDGQAAWRILEIGAEPVDIIVTDIVMPVMGGVELAARVATLPSPPPLIFISGYGRGLISTDRPFLIKPFDPSQLTALIARVLRERSA